MTDNAPTSGILERIGTRQARVGVIGLGYVGLPLAVEFALEGFDVTGFDVDAWKVADKIRGRVSGILLTQRVMWVEPKTGAQKRNRYAELAAAGIPVAFHSAAEEGAAELPLMAAYAVSQGMSPEAALRALTFDAARMLTIDERVGRIQPGLDADIVLFDRSPIEAGLAGASVVRVWINGREV